MPHWYVIAPVVVISVTFLVTVVYLLRRDTLGPPSSHDNRPSVKSAINEGSRQWPQGPGHMW